MTMAPGFGMEPTQPTLHPAGDAPPPADEPPPPTHQPWAPPPRIGGPELGSRGLRLIAYVADSLLVSFIVGAIFIVIMFFVAFLPGDPPDQMPIAGAIGILISILYWPFWWSRDGQTLAMMPLGLRVVDQESEATISFGRALLRLIVLAISIAVFFLGVLWVFVDKQRRGWHDLAAKTIVIGER
jgi:uncharacterized RDD family membrane protein YckC